MTKNTIPETAALKALLSETSDHLILAEMPGFVTDRLMALDVDQLCGAAERMNALPGGGTTEMDIARADGRRVPGPSMSRFPNCGRSRISRSFWNPAAPRKRR